MNIRLFALLCFATVLTVWVGCKKDKDEEKPVFFVDLDIQATPFPSNGATNQSCLTKIYLSFNNAIEIDYTNTDPSFIYRIVIDSTWMCTSDNQLVPATVELNSIKNKLTYTPTGGLVASTGYQINLTYHIEVKEKSTDAYEVMQKDGQPFQGTFESTFSTREYNYSIDSSNVEYSYPVANQYHFLRKETTRGVLKLKSNQENDLYYKNETYKVRISSLTGQSWESDATYNADERKYIFQIPSNNLENQKIYRIEYIMVNGTRKSETVFLTYHFRTSKFDTFEEKISTISNIKYYTRYPYQGITFPLRYFEIDEPFDLIEGKPYEGLVQFDATVDTENSWLSDVYWFYNGLKTSQFKLNRSNHPILIPPTNNIIFSNEYLVPLLTNEQISINIAEDRNQAKQIVIYQICYSFSCDWNYIWGCISNSSTPLNSWEQEMKNRDYHGMRYNLLYLYNVQYVVDGEVTSKSVWDCTI